MIRAIIVAKGKVQKVRYRSKVKEIASELGIVGEVENLDDGSIRIVADAEKEVLDDFIKKIKINNYLIDVQDVSVCFEDATGEFSAFKKVISGTMYEVAERLDEAADVLERLTGVVSGGNKEMVGTIQSGNEKIIDTIQSGDEMLAGKIDDFHADTVQSFDSVDEKYGKIAENMERILEELKEERKEYRESIEKLVAAIIELKKGG